MLPYWLSLERGYGEDMAWLVDQTVRWVVPILVLVFLGFALLVLVLPGLLFPGCQLAHLGGPTPQIPGIVGVFRIIDLGFELVSPGIEFLGGMTFHSVEAGDTTSFYLGHSESSSSLTGPILSSSRLFDPGARIGHASRGRTIPRLCKKQHYTRDFERRECEIRAFSTVGWGGSNE